MDKLKFTTCAPQAFGAVDAKSVRTKIPKSVELSGAPRELRGRAAYIHGVAESDAGYDIPIFYEGDYRQLDQPIDEQDIVMVLDSIEHSMKSIFTNRRLYYLVYEHEAAELEAEIGIENENPIVEIEDLSDALGATVIRIDIDQLIGRLKRKGIIKEKGDRRDVN